MAHNGDLELGHVGELEPEDPPRLGPYRIVGRLGAGGMGVVYLGVDRGGRRAAVKTVHGRLARSEDFRRRFVREIDGAGRVSSPRVAPVLDADATAGTPWLATAYVPGVALHDAVARYGPLPERTLRVLAVGLADALAAVHAAGLVHRDVKPSNVLLTGSGPVLVDFGIALDSDASRLTVTGEAVGTPSYMSPEQAWGGELGPSSDVFSLGGVLVYAAGGATPFREGALLVVLQAIQRDEPRLAGVPEGLLPLIRQCLAKEPGARPGPDAIRRMATDDGSAGAAGPDWLPSSVMYDLLQVASRALESGDAPGAERVLPSGAETTWLREGAPPAPPGGAQPWGEEPPPGRAGTGGRNGGGWVGSPPPDRPGAPVQDTGTWRESSSPDRGSVPPDAVGIGPAGGSSSLTAYQQRYLARRSALKRLGRVLGVAMVAAVPAWLVAGRPVPWDGGPELAAPSWQRDIEWLGRDLVADANTIAVSTLKGMYGFDTEGRQLWRHEGHFTRLLLVEGTLFAGREDGVLRAYSARSGAQLWEGRTARGPRSNLVLADGALRFYSLDGNFYAVEAASGAVRHRQPLNTYNETLVRDGASLHLVGNPARPFTIEVATGRVSPWPKERPPPPLTRGPTKSNANGCPVALPGW